MKNTPALKLAVVNDFHVGGQAGGGFQNPYLTTDAARLLAPTINAINASQPDLVLIPGDLTQNAADHELAQVQACLAEISCPYIVCKGNHDRETPEAAARFDAAFEKHACTGVHTSPAFNLPDSFAVLVLESSWRRDKGQKESTEPPLASPDPGLVEDALAVLERIKPAWLLVVSHYPLNPEDRYVHATGGKYAGHVRGGEKLLAELTKRANRVVSFNGHNHYHHITSGERWLQCSTAALAEYPAEFRLVTIEHDAATISTASGASHLVATAPEPHAPWVFGRPEDREFTWRPG